MQFVFMNCEETTVQTGFNSADWPTSQRQNSFYTPSPATFKSCIGVHLIVSIMYNTKACECLIDEVKRVSHCGPSDMSCNACIPPTSVLSQCVGRITLRQFAQIALHAKRIKELHSVEVLNLPCSASISRSDPKYRSPLNASTFKQRPLTVVSRGTGVFVIIKHRLPTRHSSTYISGDQEGPAQVLVKREAPSFSIAIHAGNILLHCLIVEPEPYTIIIVDLLTEKQRGDPRHTWG